MSKIVVSLKQRPWQRPLVAAFRNGIKHGNVVAHRRAGKDRVALFIELEQALKQPCEVWHALPEQEHARKVIWSAITGQGKRLIDEAFPREIRSGQSESEMKINLVNGSIWRLVGADRFNALVGANPRHVTFSEFAITNPQAREFIRPILAENGGSELEITTPRGYNHAFDLFQYAMKSPNWYAAIHPVSDTKLIPQDVLDEERASMPDELYRQEYECDWSAANVGSVVGRYIEAAEKQGRLDTMNAAYDADGPDLIVSSDIGFRDMSAWWFWQPRADGWALVDYLQESGMDADDWIEKIRGLRYNIRKIYLPRDAKAKTFQSKRSAVERFLTAFGADKMGMVPPVTIADRINAARLIIPRCQFAPLAMTGVKALRAWQFDWLPEAKTFSKEPIHDWSCHGGDAFSYGATVLRDAPKPDNSPKPPAPGVDIGVPLHETFNLEDLYAHAEINPRTEKW